jgi:hypothetical protein
MRSSDRDRRREVSINDVRLPKRSLLGASITLLQLPGAAISATPGTISRNICSRLPNTEVRSLAALFDRLYPCCRSLLVRIVGEICAIFFDVAGVTSAYQ